MNTKKIFESADLGDLKLKNRLIRSATWEALGDKKGDIPKKLFEIYRELASGGIGAIITGFTSIADDDYYFGGMVRLSNDELMASHRKLTDVVHENDCPILVQIALGEFNRVSSIKNLAIDEMTAEDIENVKALFINAAIRAKKAGYDGVQIHAAHGFFLSRFISPAYNHRKDEYGGTAKNRGRIIIEILKEIREQCPNFHICMKINCSDFSYAGLTPEDSMTICKMCAEAGMDSIEVSGAGTSRSQIRAGVNEAYFKDFALTLADEIDIPIILVGGHRSLGNMEKVLNDGKIEFLSLSRPLVREPNLPNRWCNGETEPAKCVSCNMCYNTLGHVCIFNLKGR